MLKYTGLVSAAVILTLVVVSAAWSQEKERKNIDDLTMEELANYKYAIQVLMKSNDAKNNYQFHADLHNLFLDDPPYGCEHRSDLFFPWHRYHLHNFEKALQAADPMHPTTPTKDVTIPYWDWTKAGSGARYPKAFEEAGSVLSKSRNNGTNEPAFDADYMTKLVRDTPDWNKFAGNPLEIGGSYGVFESPAHNTMHGIYIGGLMSDPTLAAEDPIYWSFHCFIDRQWDRWQKIHMTKPTSLDSLLRGFPAKPKVEAVVDVKTLGYFYNHTPESLKPPIPIVAAALQPRDIKLRSILPDADRVVALWGGEGPFAFQLEMPKKFHRAELWLEGVYVSRYISYQLEAFLHPATVKADKAADLAPYSLGSFSMWRAHGGRPGMMHNQRSHMFLRVTDKLARLNKGHEGETWRLTLFAVPADATAPAKNDKKPNLREEIRFEAVHLLLDNANPLRDAKEMNHGK